MGIPVTQASAGIRNFCCRLFWKFWLRRRHRTRTSWFFLFPFCRRIEIAVRELFQGNLHELHLHEIAIKIYLSRHRGRDYSDASIIILRNYRSSWCNTSPPRLVDSSVSCKMKYICIEIVTTLNVDQPFVLS